MCYCEMWLSAFIGKVSCDLSEEKGVVNCQRKRLLLNVRGKGSHELCSYLSYKKNVS